MDAAAQLAAIERFRSYLGIDAAAMARLGHRLTQHPIPLSELADLGHACPLGQQFADRWLDIATPAGFAGVRELIGANLLMDAAANHRLIDPSGRARMDLALKSYPVFKHIRQGLAADLVAAAPLEPWPGMRSPFVTPILLLVPREVVAITTKEGNEHVAAILIRCRETSAGLSIEWACWGSSSGGACGDGPEYGPTPNPISRLAWGAVALLNSEVEEVVVTSPGARTGFIRNKRDRPGPSWLEPRRRYVSEGSSTSHRKGEGPSPRGHWRKSHAHRFRVGPGRKQERIHWIPPIWCSGEGED
jgi:hypothetical protein